MVIIEITRNGKRHTDSAETLENAEIAYRALCAFEEKNLKNRRSGYVCAIKVLTDDGIAFQDEFTVAG